MEQDEQTQVRLKKLQQIRDRGQNPYRNAINPTHLAKNLHRDYREKSKEELEKLAVPVSVAGRMLALREFGKAAFVRLQDRTGDIQLYVQKASLGDEAFDQFRELDLGDIVFVKGTMFRTKTGELSIHAQSLELITKSLRPLPEKFHGIADIEIKYRQRYLDLMTSPEDRDVFMKRSKIIEEIRAFFKSRDYIEVETPMMHPVAGGAMAKPFVTHHNALDMNLFLRIAPELYLKRLVVGGFERVFEINRNFRNEGISIKHNPEFTMLEFYQSYATYEDLMPLTEELFQKVSQAVLGKLELEYQGKTIPLKSPWTRLSVEDSILKYSGFKDRAKLRDRAALMKYAQSKKYPVFPTDPAGSLMMRIFEHEVEEHLIEPTFITGYPSDESPLSRKRESDPFLVDRFELYMNGWEMANAFSELNDPQDQYARFEAQLAARKAGNEEACEMDEDYVLALEYGMPPAAGEGIGIDRMTMLFTNSASIRDVILFPLLRMKS